MPIEKKSCIILSKGVSDMIERLNRYRQQLLAVLIAEVAVAFVCYMMLHDHAFLIFSIIIAIANGLVGYAVFRNLAELE